MSDVGYGKSKEATTSNTAAFVKEVVEYVQGDVKIIVSPSKSGYRCQFLSCEFERYVWLQRFLDSFYQQPWAVD